jgi:hypothetical protein
MLTDSPEGLPDLCDRLVKTYICNATPTNYHTSNKLVHHPLRKARCDIGKGTESVTAPEFKAFVTVTEFRLVPWNAETLIRLKYG